MNKLLPALALAALLTLPAAAGASAIVPPTLGYQGRLYDSSSVPIDGSVSVTFALYPAASGGVAVWSETQVVTFASGYFAVQLGAVTPLTGVTNQGALYLGVRVGADAEMTPRAAVTSVPYALRAAAADSAPPDARFGEASAYPAADGNGETCTMGQVMLSAATVSGGLVADGRLLLISENEALFALLGTMYGGDGMTTFALPDLRNAAPNGLTYYICDLGVFPSRR